MNSLRALSTVPSIPKQSIDSFINEQTQTDKSVNKLKFIIDELLAERYMIDDILQYLSIMFTIEIGRVNNEFFDNKYILQYNNREVVINFNTNEVINTNVRNLTIDNPTEYD